jgi:short-subunit dehydrogenase
MKSYALITGASRGFGKALAIEVSKRNISTLLVSLPGEGLEEVCCELRESYGVDSLPFETDLSITENRIDLARRINKEYEVFMLMNNVGIGGSKRFTDAELGYINNILQLNVTCTVFLTHQLLPNLMRQEKAYILNVSSIAAYNPTGYKTVYPASKSFIYSFSLGLYRELKDTTLHVSVVCPGAMKTNEDISKRIENQGFFAKLILTDTEKTAGRSIEGMLAKKAVIPVNRGIRIVSSILPVLWKLKMVTETVKREINLIV